MSPEENKRLVRRYYEEVVNTGNVDDIAEFISSDYVEVYQNTVHPIGLKGAKEHVLGVRRVQLIPKPLGVAVIDYEKRDIH